ncbi:hypothetical protein F4778DRAFT_781221 [Xylariomycetidae sp. FL2044]|nr:hypothetical protein F4778DRAFT_781221 [Xylariomycetidae sp. FL2044]
MDHFHRDPLYNLIDLLSLLPNPYKATLSRHEHEKLYFQACHIYMVNKVNSEGEIIVHDFITLLLISLFNTLKEVYIDTEGVEQSVCLGGFISQRFWERFYWCFLSNTTPFDPKNPKLPYTFPQAQIALPALPAKIHRLLTYWHWHYHGKKDHEYPRRRKKDEEEGDAGGTAEPQKFDYSTLPSALVSSSPCANCGSKSTSFRCGGCSMRVRASGPISISTKYCNQECQSAHWQAHQRACAGIRHVVHAAQLMQDIFLCCESRMSITDCVGSYRKFGLIVHKSRPRLDDIRLGMTGQPALQPFPGLENFGNDTEARALILAYTSALYPLEKVIRFFIGFLGHSCLESIRQIRFLPKNAAQVLNFESGPGRIRTIMSACHVVWWMKLAPDVEVAIDPFCKIFGWTDIISNWDHYKKHRIERIAEKTQLGQTSGEAPWCQQARQPYLKAHRAVFNNMIPQVLKTASAMGSQPRRYPFAISDELFAQLRIQVLNMAKEECLSVLAQQPVARLYLDDHFTTRIYEPGTPDDPEEYLRSLWITDARFDEIKDYDEDALKGWWKTRLDSVSMRFDSRTREPVFE